MFAVSVIIKGLSLTKNEGKKVSGFGLGSAAYINNYGRARLGANTKLSVTGPGRAGKSRPDPTSNRHLLCGEIKACLYTLT